MNKKHDIYPVFFWVALSLFVMFGSCKLGLGTFKNAGSGLMPFLLGIILLLVSVLFAVKSFIEVQTRKAIALDIVSDGVKLWKVALVSGSLIAYALLLEKLGFQVSTLLLLLILFRTAGSRKWKFILAASILTMIVTYLIFSFLGVRFPKGMLGI